METTIFIGKIAVNSVASLFYFGFKYIWMLFKNMRSKPLVISQLKAVAMILIPVVIVLRYPLHILICIYCIAAMIYSLRSVYQDEIEYEKEYHRHMSLDRRQRYLQAKEAYQEKYTEKEDKTEEQKQTNNIDKNNTSTGYMPFEEHMTLDEAKSKYHQLLKMGHPDNGGDEEFSKFITQEYAKFCSNHTAQLDKHE